MSLRAAILWGLFVSAGACSGNDLGKRCQPTTAVSVPCDPIGGENPVVEWVSLERSTTCESFQCLSQGGFEPYCTRECSYSSSGGAACTTDADCKRPQHCLANECRDDDCPAGFECLEVQPIGPLAGRLYCVYQQGCTTSRDCEALGDMDCVRMGCFDSALLTPTSDQCVPHTLTCEPLTDLKNCTCTGGGTDCSGANLECKYGDGTLWPAGSVDAHGVCQRHGS